MGKWVTLYVYADVVEIYFHGIKWGVGKFVFLYQLRLYSSIYSPKPSFLTPVHSVKLDRECLYVIWGSLRSSLYVFLRPPGFLKACDLLSTHQSFAQPAVSTAQILILPSLVSPSPSPSISLSLSLCPSCRSKRIVNSTLNVPVGNRQPALAPLCQNLVRYVATPLSTKSTRCTTATPSAAAKPMLMRICAINAWWPH